MSLRCSVIFCLVLAAQSALIKRRNIPVEIVYDKINPSQYTSRNLDAKIQLSSDELLRLKLSDDIINADKLEEVDDDLPHGNPYGVRNLDAKVQLSPEEFGQSVKFLPNTVDDEALVTSVKPEENEKATEAPEPQTNTLVSLLKKAEEVVYSGVNSMKNNIDAMASDVAPSAKPSSESWVKLNQTLEQFFKDQYKRASTLKADGDNQSNNQNNNQSNGGNQFMEFFMNGFNTIMQNFGQGNNQKPGGTEDEGTQQQNQQNWAENVMNFWSQGFTQIVNNINNLNPQNKPGGGQEDTGTGTGNNPANGIQNFFGNVATQLQGFFGGNNEGNNPSNNSPSQQINQSDTGVQPPASSGNPLQAFANQFIQIIRPQNPATQAPVQGDEGTTPSSATTSNFIQGIQQGFQNLVNPQGGSSGGSGGSNPIISGAQAIGSQIGQVIGGQGGSEDTGSGGGSNPVASGAETIGNQIAQFGGQGGSNPITSGAQAIGTQLGQLGGGQGGAGGSNPITSGAQAIGSQLGQFGGNQGGNNPLGTIQNVFGGGGSTASSTEKSKSEVSEKKNEEVAPEATESQTQNSQDEKKATEMMQTAE